MSAGALDIRIAGRYRLGRKIGSGSFGDIYLGAPPRGPGHRAWARVRGPGPAGGLLTRAACVQASTFRPARRSA